MAQVDLSWEPCILKHPRGYDNGMIEKLDYNRNKKGHVMAFDTQTLMVCEYADTRAASEQICTSMSNIRSAISRKTIINSRYILAYSGANLFEAMQKNGYQ